MKNRGINKDGIPVKILILSMEESAEQTLLEIIKITAKEILL